MTEETNKPEVVTPAAPATTGAPASAPRNPRYLGRGGSSSARNSRPPRRGGRDGGKEGDKRGGKSDRSERKSEFDQKTISVRRVARVMAGGRRFSFSVALIAGDRKGRVGVGLGKAGDTAAAIDKALRDAKKHMIKVPLTENLSIPFNVSGKHGASRVDIRPAKSRGLVAGSSVRSVLELGGISDVTAKVLSRSRNKLNNARAAIHALEQLK
ncbi:MAG: 30S ribosomal protein S5 [Minisyncoccia bacterium]